MINATSYAGSCRGSDGLDHRLVQGEIPKSIVHEVFGLLLV